MASILSWAEKAVKDVENRGQAVAAQVNPLDNDRTYNTVRQQGAQYAPKAPASVLHQATHNGLSNTVGGAVKFIPQVSQNYNNTFANLGNRLAGRPNQTIQQNLGGDRFSNAALKMTGATGTNKQLAGGVAQVGLSAVGGGIDKLAAGGAAKLAPKLAPKIAKTAAHSISAGIVNAGFGASATAGDGGTAKDVKKAAITGAAVGAALPVIGVAAKPLAKQAGKAGQKVVTAAAKQVDNVVHPKFNGLSAKQIVKNPEHLQAMNAYQQSVYNQRPLPVGAQTAVSDALHKATKETGVDFVSGSPLERANRIADYQELHAGALPAYQESLAKPRLQPLNQGGYAKIPGGGRDPAPDLHPDQKNFINEYANMIEDLGAGNGVDIHPDGRRISNNVRSAENKGKSMTKQDWFDEARKELESGKAAYGASDEYKAIKPAALEIPEGFDVPAKPSPVIKKAENDFIDKKISAAQLEKIRNQQAKQVKTPKVSTKNLPDASPYTTKKGHILIDKDGNQYTVAGKPWNASALNSSFASVKDANGKFIKNMNLRGMKNTSVDTAPKPSRPQIPKQELKTPTPNPTVNNAPIDVAQHLQDQLRAQEAARKVGHSSGISKFAAEGKTKLVDSFAPIEDTLNRRVTPENAVNHITPQIDRVLRADMIGGQYIKDKGLDKIIQSVPNTKEFDQYLIAKHAPSFEAEHGIGSSGRNLAADKQLVDALGAKYEPHAQAINKYSQDLLDKAADYGLVSKEAATALKQRYPNYVPLQRIFGEDELTKPPKGTGGGKVSISSQSIVQKAKGSQRSIESPLDSIVHKTMDVVEQGERNKAAQILAGYKNLEGNPFELRELGKDEVVGQKHVISFLDNGKQRRFETSSEIAAAAKSLNKEQIGLLGQVFAAPVRTLRLGATSLNPAFTLANVAKDSASAFINSSAPVRSSVGNPKVFVAALKASLHHGSKEYGELVREGAGGTSYDMYRNDPVRNVAAIRSHKNAGTRALYTARHPAELIRYAENTIGRSEEFNRALQYYGNKDKALSKNLTQGQAVAYGAHSARNNTVNFARGGDWGKVINSSIPYLNAGIQGSRTLIRNLKERPAQTTAKLAMTAFFPAAVVTAWNTSDPDRKAAYDDLKDYVKQGNLIIVPPHPVKDKAGNWNVIKLPVSQEIANLTNIVREGIEAGVGDGSINIASLLGDVAGTATSLNLGSPRQTVGQLLPQAVKPGIEALTNQNLFTGNKIVPDSQKNLPGRDQVGDNTSGTATQIGKRTGISPRHIDNFVKTAGGGLSQNIVNATDNALAKAGVINQDQIKGKSVGAAIKGRFSGAQGSSPYDYADKQYKELSKKLENLPDYKNMSPQDKAKALNRLETQVTAANVPGLDKQGNQKMLTTRQQDIASGKPDLKSYLTASTSSGGSKAKTYAEKQAKYDADVKAGKLTRFEQETQGQSLAREKITSTYSKDMNALYGKSKGFISDYLANDPDGNRVAKDLQDLDQKLVDAGFVKTPKFKYGFATAATGKKSSGGRKTGGKGRTAVPKIAKIKTPKVTTKMSKFTLNAPKTKSFKTSGKKLPKYAAKTPKVTTKKA